MPAAIAVPLVIAGASLIATNAGNKAAIKNNEVQQASAVGNAKDAWNTAQSNVAAWEKANPSPVSGASVARPTAGAYGSGGMQSANRGAGASGLQGAGGIGNVLKILEPFLRQLQQGQGGAAAAQPGAVRPVQQMPRNPNVPGPAAPAPAPSPQPAAPAPAPQPAPVGPIASALTGPVMPKPTLPGVDGTGGGAPDMAAATLIKRILGQPVAA